MMSGKTEIVVIGDIFADFVSNIVSFPANGSATYGSTFVRTHGGCGGNIASGLGVLGIPTAMFCRLGDDDTGHFLKNGMAEYGVDNHYITLDKGKASGMVVITVDPTGERTIFVFANDAAYEYLSPEDVAPIGEIAPRAIFFSGVLLGTHPAEETLLAVAEQYHGKARLYFDPNLRYPAGAVPPDLARSMRRLAELSDVVLAGKDECDALEITPKKGQTFIVKNGKEGSALMREDGGFEFSIPATEHKAINATGAGDAYAAAYAAAELRGKDIREAMEFATVASGISVTKQGARCMPTPEEIDIYISGR